MALPGDMEHCVNVVIDTDDVSDEILGRLKKFAVEYHPFGDFPIEPVLSLVDRVGDKLSLLTDKPFNRRTNVLMGLFIRCIFVIIRDSQRLLCPELLSEPARAAIDKGVAILNLCENRFGEIPTILYYKASLQYWKSNVEDAYLLFDKFRYAYIPAHGDQLDQIGAFSMRTLGEITRIAQRDAMPRRKATFLKCQPEDYIVVVCLDEHYFRKYAKRMLDSLAPYEDVAVHFHIASNNPLEVVNELPRRTSLSFESDPDVADKIPYYQAMRFLRMREFMMAYKKPLLFVDADFHFSQHPKYLFDANAGNDIGLNYNAIVWVPWRKFSASEVYVNYTTKSFVFARYLRNLFMNIYVSSGMNNFWIDQAILAHAVEVSRIIGNRIRVVDNRATNWRGAIHEK